MIGLRLLVCVLLSCGTIHAAGQLTYQNLEVIYDSAWTFKNLSLIPVRFKGPPAEGTSLVAGLQTISLPEALMKNKVKIKEVLYEDGADLNWLQIVNNSKQSLVINSGDLLAGGKQDRLIGETKIIAPGASDYLKVFCIEKGRWDDKIKQFHHSGTADVGVKKVMDVTGRQMEVWKEIEGRFGAGKIPSTTWPYLQLYKNYGVADSSYIRYFMQKFRQSDSAYAGFLAVTGNQIISCELFAASNLTRVAFPGMLSSLVLSVAKSSPPVMPVSAMKKFMDELLKNEFTQKIFVAAHGQMHLYQGKVMHIIVYGS